MKLLTPFFDIVSDIIMETDIELRVSICTHGNGMKLLSWYVGDAENPTHGGCTDQLRLDALDEDKLDRWVAELDVIYEEEMGLCEEPDEGEEPREEIARTENAILDKENRK